MKKIIVLLAMALCLVPFSSILADPWMISAEVPGGSWDKIEMKWDGGTPVLVDPFTKANGKQILQYDCAGVTIGAHSVSLRGKKGVWYSAIPFVFTFTKPSISDIGGVGLSESPQQ